jgi:hypothetical protein
MVQMYTPCTVVFCSRMNWCVRGKFGEAKARVGRTGEEFSSYGSISQTHH